MSSPTGGYLVCLIGVCINTYVIYQGFYLIDELIIQIANLATSYDITI